MKSWPPRLQVTSAFNFAPKCQMHLRNLRAYYVRMVAKAEKAIGSEIEFYRYAQEALPRLDAMIKAGAFSHLPEVA